MTKTSEKPTKAESSAAAHFGAMGGRAAARTPGLMSRNGKLGACKRWGHIALHPDTDTNCSRCGASINHR